MSNIDLQMAIDFARTFHKGQKYAGKDYFLSHVQPVALDVSNYIALHPDLTDLIDEEVDSLVAIAYLHDIVEDTTFTLDMVEEFFGDRIKDAVDALTKREGEEYNDYINRVCEDWMARIVKGRDSQRNYLQCLKDKNYKRAKKYQFVLEKLEEFEIS